MRAATNCGLLIMENFAFSLRIVIKGSLFHNVAALSGLN